ncbi:MAG: peptidyl-prolyl cis-trans isomerase [Polyangiaceae bacterium]
MATRPAKRLSRSRVLRQLASLALLGAVALASSASAQSEDPVVVRVGNVELRRSDVERRLRDVPAFKLRQYGNTPEEIKRAFIERDLVPEVLFGLDTNLEEATRSPTVRAEVNQAKLQALQTALRKELAQKSPVTDADIEKYYKDHETRFKTPERIKLWRILLPTEEAAAAVLKQVKAKGDVKTWSQVAREKSIDKATNMRDGDLGFVLPSGLTNVPRVRVEPALYEAAKTLKNGELAQKPIPEGKGFAVLWRRGSLNAVERSLESESANIRRLLERERTRKQLDDLVKGLVAAHVKDRNDALLENVALDKIGAIGAERQPGLMDKHPPEADVKPSSSGDPAAGAGKR